MNQIFQAKLWAASVTERCNNLSDLDQQKLNMVLRVSRSDYPHITVTITRDGIVAGTRRVFGDNSVADMFFDQPGKIFTEPGTFGSIK